MEGNTEALKTQKNNFNANLLNTKIADFFLHSDPEDKIPYQAHEIKNNSNTNLFDVKMADFFLHPKPEQKN